MGSVQPYRKKDHRLCEVCERKELKVPATRTIKPDLGRDVYACDAHAEHLAAIYKIKWP